MLRHVSLSWIRLSWNPYIGHLPKSLSQFRATAFDLDSSNSHRSGNARRVLSYDSPSHTPQMKGIPLQRWGYVETSSERRKRLVPVLRILKS
jgi:hypothetical protein